MGWREASPGDEPRTGFVWDCECGEARNLSITCRKCGERNPAINLPEPVSPDCSPTQRCGVPDDTNPDRSCLLPSGHSGPHSDDPPDCSPTEQGERCEVCGRRGAVAFTDQYGATRMLCPHDTGTCLRIGIGLAPASEPRGLGFTYERHSDHPGGYKLTFPPDGFQRGANATERKLIDALAAAEKRAEELMRRLGTKSEQRLAANARAESAEALLSSSRTALEFAAGAIAYAREPHHLDHAEECSPCPVAAEQLDAALERIQAALSSLPPESDQQ